MLNINGKKAYALYYGGQKIKEAYLGSQLVFRGFPRVTMEDLFNSQVLSSWWVENTGIAFNGSYIRCSNNKKATTSESLSTGADVAERDSWRVDVVLADIPDPVQESSIVIGPDKSNGLVVSFAPNRMWIGTMSNGSSSILASTTATKLTASSTISMTNNNGALSLSTSDGVTLTANATNPAVGPGNRKMTIIQRVFRGGAFNANYYYSPGIDSVRVTTL